MKTRETRPSNKDIVTALKATKTFLSWDTPYKYNINRGICIHRRKFTETSVYICFALNRTADNNPDLKKATQFIKKLIIKRLGKSVTLAAWLAYKGYPAYQNPEKVQETRHAWLNGLIKEFSK
jgi:hypothetical protein